MQKKFLWGAATSAHQVEGNNHQSDWWAWEAEGKIERGERSGAATDHWNRYDEDLRLAEEMGLTSYRFSIEWSRIEPKEGQWDSQALAWYQNLIAACAKRKLAPMATLLHFTLPQWLADRGGIAWGGFPERFAEFSKHVARALPEVSLWCTINEPFVMVVGQYLGGFMPPAIHDVARASRACRNLFEAHVLAYDGVREILKAKRDLGVGFAHNMMDFLPRRPWHPADRIFAGMFHRFYNLAWLDAVAGKPQRFGIHGVLPIAEPYTPALGRVTTDFIGINYYTKVYLGLGVRPGDTPVGEKLPIGLSFQKSGDTMSDVDWAIHPKGLGKMLRLASRYGLPLYVTENGIADREDRFRGEYLRTHLLEVAHAIERGADVRGYYHWSLTDNFEWAKGFEPRFGLVEVNYENFERKARASARCLADIVKSHVGEEGQRPSEEVLERTRSKV